MELKKAKTISEQINLLRLRGMIIDDEELANIFLMKNQYYRLNIYFHKLMSSPDHFDKTISFSKIIAVYENDRWLRNNILSILEEIEISTRTQVAYYLALKYGSEAFYREGIFKNQKKYLQICKNFNIQISRNKKDPVVIHHKEKYGNKFPIWVIVEFVSFNTLSKLYANLLEKDKKEIANNINKINDYLFGQWLHVLSIQRNICAHYGYLFRREYPIRPIIAKSFNWNNKFDNELFAQFLVMRQLMDNKKWEEFIHLIYNSIETRQYLDMNDYGFPENWSSYLF